MAFKLPGSDKKLNNMKKTGIWPIGLAAIAMAVFVMAFTESHIKELPGEGEWSDEAQKALEVMTKKYGPPQDKTKDMAIWYNAGPWKKTILHAKAVEHNFPKPHKDVLQQYIDYKVPVDKFTPVAEFDGSVIAERTNGQLSATCDKEEMNLLAINLANDVATGKKSVDEAREFYTKTAVRFMKGDKDQYTQKLMFDVAKGNTGDPDKMGEMGDMIKGVMSKDGEKKQK